MIAWAAACWLCACGMMRLWSRRERWREGESERASERGDWAAHTQETGMDVCQSQETWRMSRQWELEWDQTVELQTRRDLAADSSGCSINLGVTAAAQQEDYSWPLGETKQRKKSPGVISILMTAGRYFCACLSFLLKVHIAWISLGKRQGRGSSTDENRFKIKHRSHWIDMMKFFQPPG